MKKIYLSLFIAFLSFYVNAQVLTYKDVAGAFYKSCTGCHHEGANMYSFMNYTKVNLYKNMIQSALNNNRMPPWKADTNYTRFRHERLISATDKSKILNWIATGATKGDTTQAPAQPSYPPKYKLVGNADLTISIPTFTSFATSGDIYVCFSVPSGLTQDRIIRAYEIVPGNPSIVHHAVITADTTGTYASDMSGICVNIPGNLELGTYAPGTQAQVFPSMPPLKTGIRLKAGSKVILQMHYPAGSVGQIDSTKIRFYFYPPGEPGVRQLTISTPLQNWSMSIPANTTPTHVANYPSATGTLAAPLSLYGVFPHSHKLGKSMLLYAVKPGIDTIPMVKIPDWDFNWQDYYLYKKLVKIPAGYRLHSRHVFNNTTSNLNNPNNPPINVSAGFGTNDEMLFDGTMTLPYQTGDELIDIEAIVNADTLWATNVKEIKDIPFKLSAQAYPNPFTTDVSIKYMMNLPGEVLIEITDLLGRVMVKHNEGKKDSGLHDYTLKGNQLPKGIYLLTIKSNGSSYTEKLIKTE